VTFTPTKRPFTEDNKRLYLQLLLIIVATFVVYLRSFNGGFIWDDQTFIVDNPFLTNLSGLWKIWFTTELKHQYYPMVSTTFWIERHIFGLNPVGYHIVNIALHAVNAALVFIILKRLSIRGALAVALIFALHPVHADSAAFINERKNVLSGLFYLFALLSFLSFEETNSKKFYALALFGFLLALLSKTVAGSLPAIIIIIAWMRHKEINLKYLSTLLPFFFLSAIFAVVTISVEMENTGVEIGLSFAERLLVAGRATWFYALKLIAPVNLSLIYPRWTINSSNPVEWAYPLAVVIVTAILFVFRSRLGRAPLTAALFFLITLLPAMGFVDINFFNFSFVADHFQYLASLSLITLGTGIVLRLTKKIDPRAPVALTIIVASIFSVLTWSRATLTTDHELLWRDTIEKNPKSWAARNNLGNILYGRLKREEAITQFKEAVMLNPLFDKARGNLADALTESGRFEEALIQYKSLAQISTFDSYKYYNYAIALEGLGRTNEAEEAYKKSIELNPDEVGPKNNLANIYLRGNDLAPAIALYEEIVELNPRHAPAHNNLGIIWNLKGQNNKSLSHYKLAIEADPGYAEAHHNMGITLEDLGRTGEAIKSYKEAERLKKKQ
jgi:tetratricopeptide (TPR) repeat protein